MRRTRSQASPQSVHAKSFGEEIVVIIEASISTIETMEDRRYAAMLYKDVKMLRSLLHDQLTYVHSSGTTDTKASYIAGLEAGTWDYRCIRRSKQMIKVQKSLALVFDMAIVGGAILPLMLGAIADHVGLHHAFVLPVICYLYILFYALSGSKPNSQRYKTA
jgi:hypothetical protein